VAPTAREIFDSTWQKVKTRQTLVYAILTLALILLLISSLTVWAKRQALQTDNWVDTSSQLLQNQQIRDAAAEEMVNALFTQTDIQQRITAALPADLKPLGAPAVGLVRQAAVPAAEELLARPFVQKLWQDANRLAHEKMIAILEGNEDGRITTTNGEVTLDLHPLVVQLASRLGVAADIPSNVGVIPILKSDQLKNAQTTYRFINFFSVFMVVVVLALLVLAIWLAGGFRREALRFTAIGFVLVGFLILAARRIAGHQIVDAVTSQSNRDVGNAVWIIGTSLLKGLALAIIAYGLVLLLGVWFAGRTRWAVWARRRSAPFVRDHVWMVWTGVFVLFLLLLVWGPVPATQQFWGILGIAASIILGVEALRRQIVRESAPPAA